MKKYFIFAVAALAASVACTKTNIDTDQLPDQKISFEVANYVPQTRANSSLDSEGYTSFTANAWFFNGDTKLQYMSGETVTKTTVTSGETSTTTWSPANDYFWPTNSASYINFYSYAGSQAPTVSADESTMKTVTVSYTDKTISGTDNFLVADPALHCRSTDTDNASIDNEQGEFNYSSGYNYTTSSQTYSGVPTIFRHMLAKVAVVVKLETTDAKKSSNTSWEVTVTSGNIKPVNKGSLTLKNTDNSDVTTAAIGSWSVYNGETPLTDDAAKIWVASTNATDIETITFTSKTLTMAANATSSTETDNVLLTVRTVMPQNTSGVKLNLSYKVTAKHGTTKFMEEERTITETNLGTAASSVSYWAMNQITVYTIKIDPVTEKVTFDPAVVEWDAATIGSVSVPLS